METRLIVAYSLIAIMAVLIIVGSVLISKRQSKARRRDAGTGEY